MPAHTTDALILRTYKLGESDRIVVFLTRDRGKKRGVAKNARQSRRRFGGALEPLTIAPADVDFAPAPLAKIRGGDPQENAERLRALLAGMKSLDEHEGVTAFHELSAEDLGGPPMSVERLVELQLEHEKLDRLLRSLAQREEQVLRIRYGFHDGIARSLAETGEHFGISRERVRQIESRALAKLRRAIDLADLDRENGEVVH